MEKGKFYHIYNRGNNRQKIFFEKKNYHHFLNRFDKYLSDLVSLYAYSLMPNHFHFLIKVKGDIESDIWLRDQPCAKIEAGQSEVEKAFKHLFMSYAKGMNNNYNRTGALFQQKYKRKEITSAEYLTKVIQYIHANPLRAGLCKDYEEWPFSSYRAIISEKPTKIDRQSVLGWFGGRERFIEVHENYRLDKLPWS